MLQVYRMKSRRANGSSQTAKGRQRINKRKTCCCRRKYFRDLILFCSLPFFYARSLSSRRVHSYALTKQQITQRIKHSHWHGKNVTRILCKPHTQMNKCKNQQGTKTLTSSRRETGWWLLCCFISKKKRVIPRLISIEKVKLIFAFNDEQLLVWTFFLEGNILLLISMEQEITLRSKAIECISLFIYSCTVSVCVIETATSTSMILCAEMFTYDFIHWHFRHLMTLIRWPHYIAREEVKCDLITQQLLCFALLTYFHAALQRWKSNRCILLRTDANWINNILLWFTIFVIESKLWNVFILNAIKPTSEKVEGGHIKILSELYPTWARGRNVFSEWKKEWKTFD